MESKLERRTEEKNRLKINRTTTKCLKFRFKNDIVGKQPLSCDLEIDLLIN